MWTFLLFFRHFMMQQLLSLIFIHPPTQAAAEPCSLICSRRPICPSPTINQLLSLWKRSTHTNCGVRQQQQDVKAVSVCRFTVGSVRIWPAVDTSHWSSMEVSSYHKCQFGITSHRHAFYSRADGCSCTTTAGCSSCIFSMQPGNTATCSRRTESSASKSVLLQNTLKLLTPTTHRQCSVFYCSAFNKMWLHETGEELFFVLE